MPCAPFEGFFPCVGDFQEVPEENKWGWEGSRGCKIKINHSSGRSVGRGNAPRVGDEGEQVMLQSPKQAAGARGNGSAPKNQGIGKKQACSAPNHCLHCAEWAGKGIGGRSCLQLSWGLQSIAADPGTRPCGAELPQNQDWGLAKPHRCNGDSREGRSGVTGAGGHPRSPECCCGAGNRWSRTPSSSPQTLLI